MNILAVDDNRFALESLTADLKAARPNAEIDSFTSARKALEFVNTSCRELHAAFLDVEMPGMSGIELAVSIKKKFPRTAVIFVTAYSDYALEAFKVHANGYLVKPVMRELLERELAELPQPFVAAPKSRIRAHTFGNFELFADDAPIRFARSKSKELVAYLIDRRGALCSMNELAAVLFEDGTSIKNQQSYIRNLINDIKTTLSGHNAAHIIRKEHNAIAINVETIDCDYYRMLDGEPAAVNQFLGEYMVNYDWAEFTVGELEKIREEL